MATVVLSKHLAKNVWLMLDAEREVTEQNRMAGSHHLVSNMKQVWQTDSEETEYKQKIWLLMSYTKLI